jgi:hypothetical protein
LVSYIPKHRTLLLFNHKAYIAWHCNYLQHSYRSLDDKMNA